MRIAATINHKTYCAVPPCMTGIFGKPKVINCFILKWCADNDCMQSSFSVCSPRGALFFSKSMLERKINEVCSVLFLLLLLISFSLPFIIVISSIYHLFIYSLYLHQYLCSVVYTTRGTKSSCCIYFNSIHWWIILL